MADDWSLLEHSGLVSVQLQPPGGPDPTADPNALPAGPTDETGQPLPPADGAASDDALASAIDSIGA
jgi:hypothetical protein